ncbi:c-type cytochrome [Sulfitobacter sp. TB366]|jgi:cytochrome c|uniref:c-type cytochrome n=1 Tax=Rhodobacterales TaxID=204455 RepID=UPI0018804B61|nr:c-type cytochrome [Marivivens aquimaris]
MATRIIFVAAAVSVGIVAIARTSGLTWGAEERAARSAKLYWRECAGCHGTSLEGQQGWQEAVFDYRSAAPPLNGTGHTMQHTDHELLKTIQSMAIRGKGHAGPSMYKSFSERDARELLDWIKSHWQKEDLREQRRAIDLAPEVFSASPNGEPGLIW